MPPQIEARLRTGHCRRQQPCVRPGRARGSCLSPDRWHLSKRRRRRPSRAGGRVSCGSPAPRRSGLTSAPCGWRGCAAAPSASFGGCRGPCGCSCWHSLPQRHTRLQPRSAGRQPLRFFSSDERPRRTPCTRSRNHTTRPAMAIQGKLHSTAHQARGESVLRGVKRYPP